MEPHGKEHSQRARRILAEEGVEMTPEEFEETRKRAYAKIRAALRAKGIPVPDDDKEFFLLMKAIGL